MRKSKIVPFRMEEVLYETVRKLAASEDISVTGLIYSGLLGIVKKKLGTKAFLKLEEKIEASSRFNGKPGRKPSLGKRPKRLVPIGKDVS